MTMLSLVETHCVPILTYGIEIADFLDAGQRSKVRAAYNSLFRKIFGYRTFESVTNLQLSLARPTWEMLCHTRKVSFHNRLAQCPAESPVHDFSVLWFDLLFLLSLFVYWNTRFDQIVWIKHQKKIVQYLEFIKNSPQSNSAMTSALLSIKWLHCFKPGLNSHNDPANDRILSRIVDSSHRNSFKMKNRKN